MRLVLDWDGTVTTEDTLGLVVERFGDPARPLEVEQARGRPLTAREWIAVAVPTVAAPLDEVVAWLLGRVRVRRGFRELVAAHRPLVVSSGFERLIRPVLAREGVEVDVVANGLDPRPAGWRPLFRDGDACPECGEVCKRAFLPAGDFAYAGDAHSDFCPAALAKRVFVCGDVLAEHLAERRVPYERFDDFLELAAALKTARGPERTAR